MDTGTLLSMCLFGFKSDAEHMCSCFNMSALHHMLEWERDRFGCFEGGFFLLVFVLRNTEVILNCELLTKKKKGEL